MKAVKVNEMYKYVKPNNKALILIVVLVLCNVLLLICNQSQRREIVGYQETNYQLELTAQRAISDLADSNEHIRAYEIRISQLEVELKEK